ncbi:ribosome-inactivating family protein [Streptomyces sp. NPDC101175]|uniref:ribosome-inactivating family protein n=1 Tax=Streptomyces sp. NPDC101175 TaxID=3366123 RepID=UPI00383549E3
MAPTDVEPAAGPRPAVLGPRRSTVASVVTTLVLAVVATLLGPLGVLSSASAADGNPTFKIGSDGTTYVNFINSIRAQVNDGGSTSVAGAGNAYQVDHTNENNGNLYLQVDIVMEDGNLVRLQFDRRNMYLLGWWSYKNTYYYLGDRPSNTPPYGERSRMDNGKRRDADRWVRVASENYSSLETAANEHRAGIQISQASINGAAQYMYNRGNNVANLLLARGALRMTQFISEAARFRPIRDDIALSIGSSGSALYLPAQLAAQENNWGALSTRFNELLHHPQGYQDPHPLTGYRRDIFGDAVAIVLTTATLYAQYILNTSKGR